MIFDFNLFSAAERYHFMTQSIIPRPIAWVLTKAENETYNLAPFSYFNAVSSQPACVMFSLSTKASGEQKDTLTCLQSNPDFTLHIPSYELMEVVNETAKELPLGESELDRTSLTLVKEDGFALPRVAEAPVAYNAKVLDIYSLPNSTQKVIFAEILHLWVKDEAVLSRKGRSQFNAKEIDPLARLGAGEFSRITDIEALKHP